MQLIVHADIAEAAEGTTVVEMPAETRRIEQEGPACPRCRTPLTDALGVPTVDATITNAPYSARLRVFAVGSDNVATNITGARSGTTKLFIGYDTHEGWIQA